jgi:hemerythrin superfamily protein
MVDNTKLTFEDIKQIFLDVLSEKLSFRDASNWASNKIILDDLEQIHIDPNENLRKMFDALHFLGGLDLESEQGVYLYSMLDIEREFKNLFCDELSTNEIIEKVIAKDWNPLNLSNETDIFNKYQPYFSEIYNLLLQHKSKEEISDSLFKILREETGLKGDKTVTDKLAQQLLDLTSDYFRQII